MRLGDGNSMIMKIDAIVREEKFEDVKNALMEIEVTDLQCHRLWDVDCNEAIKK